MSSYYLIIGDQLSSLKILCKHSLTLVHLSIVTVSGSVIFKYWNKNIRFSRPTIIK